MIKIEKVPAALVWPVRHEVMYPEHSFESIKLEADEEATHLALFDNEDLVSVLSLFADGQGLQFRKFATYQRFQGKGYGSKLLEHVIRHAKEQNYKRIWCNARENASGFYRRFGFNSTDKTFYKDGYYFVIMELFL